MKRRSFFVAITAAFSARLILGWSTTPGARRSDCEFIACRKFAKHEIARVFSVSAEDLIAANPGVSPDLIRRAMRSA